MRILIKWLFGFDKEIEQAFLNGKDVGLEQGVRDGLAMNFDRTLPITETEYKEIIDFLVAKGVELVCYDDRRGGLRLRQRAVVKKREYQI